MQTFDMQEPVGVRVAGNRKNYTHIRGHGNENLPGTWWWVWSLGLKKGPMSALQDSKLIPECSL